MSEWHQFNWIWLKAKEDTSSQGQSSPWGSRRRLSGLQAHSSHSLIEEKAEIQLRGLKLHYYFALTSFWISLRYKLPSFWHLRSFRQQTQAGDHEPRKPCRHLVGSGSQQSPCTKKSSHIVGKNGMASLGRMVWEHWSKENTSSCQRALLYPFAWGGITSSYAFSAAIDSSAAPCISVQTLISSAPFLCRLSEALPPTITVLNK